MSELDLFGNPVQENPAPAQTRPGRPVLNDMDAVTAVLERASSDRRYLLVGLAERVYRLADPTDKERVQPVTHWEADTVHQLLKSRHLTIGGGRHEVVSGAMRTTATAVLVPRATRNQLIHWKTLARPDGWTSSKYPA
ncbi:hypothetical protein [Crossiella sp. CA198]|uniref:hypothetical protein n=1 Tax=Crossiella sp. CA198 TaxID=3455607 RepID=UPI003F8D7C28